ncbi:MAG: HAMP domain-containing histidine kinase [Prolixibacteraceae bacterium]|nr:HAMP domain-containing histidine kinase [Prolixibacteraceae bacterium]
MAIDIYFKKKRWKQIIFIAAILIGIGSLLYTNKLVKQVSSEERSKVERWAEATRLFATNDDLGNEVNKFLNQVLAANNTIPIIVVDQEGNVNIDGNIKYTAKNKDKVLARELEKMKDHQEPIVIPLGGGVEQYLYYKESSLLVKLRYYPVFQMAVIILFIAISYIAFSSARNAEQNLVWIGMAKETAHQLGTPISSLIAWVELLKEENTDSKIISELVKDTDRLEKITERFSKIGSNPELYPENIYEVLDNSIQYLKSRVSKKIEITQNFNVKNELYVPLSASLFSWVIENLVRNSVDAIENNHGVINIDLFEKDNDVIIDVTDNGKGIAKSKFKTIFQPGYTTKKRGWGLGLSLSKRIIEIFHGGKIFLKNSEPKKATTFRIILKNK